MDGNIMIIGDLNINTNYNSNKLSHLTKLFEVFDLLRLTCINTCSDSSDHRSIDVCLTNRPRSFHKTSTIEGLVISDFSFF